MGDDPLALETRRRLFAVVQSTPGLSAREIQRAAGTAWGETSYHLERLEDGGLIRRERGSHQDFFFAATISEGERTVLRAARSASARRILVELLAHPDLSLAEVGSATGLSVSRTSIHLRRLIETHIVEAGHRGPFRTFRVADRARVAQLLVAHQEGYADAWVDRLVDAWSEMFPP